MNSPRTQGIIIEQTALEPWAGRIDIVDAALINHVITRLIRRKKQKIVMHADEPCVWIHYPTVRAENWLLNLSPSALQKRFTKLVNLGLLIRVNLPVSTKDSKHRGKRAYYGLAPALKARLEALDMLKPCEELKTEQDDDPVQSLSMSLGNRVGSRERAPSPAGVLAPPSRLSVREEERREILKRLGYKIDEEIGRAEMPSR